MNKVDIAIDLVVVENSSNPINQGLSTYCSIASNSSNVKITALLSKKYVLLFLIKNKYSQKTKNINDYLICFLYIFAQYVLLIIYILSVTQLNIIGVYLYVYLYACLFIVV